MLQRAHKLILLLFLAVGGVVRAQVSFDTCLDLSSYSQPEGWTICYDDGTQLPVGYVNVVYLYNPYRTGVLEISLPYTTITPNVVYVVTPDLSFDFSQNALIHFWVQGHENDIMEVGTMASASDFSTFHVIDSIVFTDQNWREVAFESTGTPPGHTRIAFRLTHASSSVYSNFYIDDLSVTTQVCWSSNYRVTINETRDSATCFWDYHGDPNMTLFVNDYTDNTWSTYLDVQGGSLTMPVVQGHRYIAYFYDTCDHTALYPCSFDNSVTVEFHVPCIDSSDCVNIGYLYSNKATPYYGTYDNPYQNMGVVELGSTNPLSRHTLNSDTSMRDPNVPSLRVIPEGESLSVRLGNWQTGGQAEALLYKIPVDTTRADMLILKYAAVLEDPNHDLTNQPRFRIEMLDSNMDLIAPVACNSYDFIASPALGWNTIAGGILWKDWTTVGIDLSAYHGQTVRLRLTTYDCKMSAHYGYAYYTLSCARKTFFFRSCTVADSNTVVAPDGFTYRWQRDDSPAVIGTNREIALPVDGHTYYCDLGFIGNPSCSVTMSVVSENVYPVAQIGYTVERDSCRFKINFQNLSHLSYDTLHHCSYTYWTFHDGSHSTQENPVVYYPDTGLYYVSLVSGYPSDGCVDTTYDTLHLSLLFDTIAAAICEESSYRFCDSLFTTAGTYTLQPHCDSIRTLTLSVKDTTLIPLHATACDQYLYRDSLLLQSGVYDFPYSDVRGCDSTYRLHLTVYESYDTVDTVFVCSGNPFVYDGVDYGHPVDFVVKLLSQHGCDSLIRVSLVSADTGFHVRAFYSFDNVLWADSLPIKACAPATLHLRDSTLGAVAWQWTLPNSSPVASPSASVLFDTPNTFDTIALRVESFHGCRDSLFWPVVVFPSPEADFGWDPATPVDVAPTVQLIGFAEPEDCQPFRWFVQHEPGSSVFDTLEGKETFYTWEGELPTGDFDVEMVTYHTQTILQPDNQLITHTCTDTARHTITIVTAYLQFPNLVSPNGDGVNDIWKVVNLLELGLYSMNELWIYNVWGTLVYHVENIRREEQFWDPNETNSPDGTYYFRFSAKGHHGLVRVNGSIEVVR